MLLCLYVDNLTDDRGKGDIMSRNKLPIVKDERVSVRISDQMRERLILAAAAAGMSLSDYVRHVLLMAAGMPTMDKSDKSPTKG